MTKMKQIDKKYNININLDLYKYKSRFYFCQKKPKQIMWIFSFPLRSVVSHCPWQVGWPSYFGYLAPDMTHDRGHREGSTSGIVENRILR